MNTMSAIELELIADTCADTLDDAIETIAEQCLSNASYFSRNNDVLDSLLQLLGISTVRYSDIPCDGLLTPLPNWKYEIDIRAHMSRARQRFTIAHEIGHVLLHAKMPETRQFETRTIFQVPGAASEERLCDRLAAALLMPRLEVLELVGDVRPTLRLVRKVAARFAVSLTAAANRIREVRRTTDLAIVELDQSTKAVDITRILLNFKKQRLPNQAQAFRPPVELSTVLDAGGEMEGWLWAGDQFRRQRVYCSAHRRTGQAKAIAVLANR